MEDTNSFEGFGNINGNIKNIILDEDGAVKPWVLPKFLSFLSNTYPSSYEGAGEIHKNTFFDEDGKVKPCVLPKFLSFLTTLNSSEGAGGNENHSEMEISNTHKASSSSETEKEFKASNPSSPGKQNEEGQKHIHEDDGGNNAYSEMEMDAVHRTSPNSEMVTIMTQNAASSSETEVKRTQRSSASSAKEMDYKDATPSSPGKVTKSGGENLHESDGPNVVNDMVHKEPRVDEARREELLFGLIHLAASIGRSATNDTSFLELCSKVIIMDRELMDKYDSTMNHARAKGKQVLPTGNDPKQINGVNFGMLQGEGSSKERDKVHGPMGTALEDIVQTNDPKDETARQRPLDNVKCLMDGQKHFTRCMKETSKGSSDDAFHIPQNMGKVAQLFQQILEDNKASQHVSQVTQNGGKSTPTHNIGQTNLVDKVRQVDHVNLNGNFKAHSDFLQQNTNEQKSGSNDTVPKVDDHGMGTCTALKVKSNFSFADVLKYGQNIKDFSLPSKHSDEKEKHVFSVLQSSHHENDDSPLFKVAPEVLEKRMALCKFSIVGRLLLSKGEQPWTQKSLKDKLQGIWGIKSAWKLISLGRGYFHILLNSQDEWDNVWSRGPLHLKPGIMRFQRWKIDFDPSTEKSSFAQVWLRIFHLPWALWEHSVIAGIARKVGVPLKFDKVTIDGEFGHYARILVDVDLSKPIKSSVHIECGKFMFEVKIVPENMPAFCRGCFFIGHDTKDCRNTLKKKDIAVPLKSFGEEERVFNSLGTLEKFSSVNSASSSKNPTAIKEVQKPKDKHFQVTEWRRKKDSGNEKTNEEKKTVNDIVESITDFCAQTDSHFSYDAFSSYVDVSNQFAALETEYVIEDTIKEGKNNDQQVQDSAIPKRWSDILDEEDEKEDSGPLHPYCDKKPQEEKAHGRNISEIRQGLQAMSQNFAHMLHTPPTNKKNKKLKHGYSKGK